MRRSILIAAVLCTVLRAASPVAGTWRGESLCGTGAPACRNETVVYYIKDLADRPDTVVIQADKIVDGKAITMGSGEWHYDRDHGTIEWRMPRQVWLLRVDGTRIQGTLTLADGNVARRMTLTKDH